MLEMQAQDKFADEWRFRGDVARESFVDELLQKDYYGDEDAILLLDGDQKHPKNMLETLRTTMREQGFDMVCAHYYARQTHTVHSLCYPLGDGTFPYQMFLDPPTTGYHKLAWAGFGSVLIKKKVLKAVASLYKPGASPIGIGPLPELVGDNDNVGPDLRFFYQARKLGFDLWLDASVESLHGVTIWLGHKSARKLMDYTDWADSNQDLLDRRLELHGVTSQAFKQRKMLLEARKRGLLAQLDELKLTDPTNQQVLFDITVALHQMDGRLTEMDAWIEWTDKYPAIETPADLPTTETMPAEDMTPHGATLEERQDSYRENAVELLQELPNVSSNGKN